MKKAIIAMSGGVDSSVAALFMKEKGYECIGATMKLYENEDIGISREKTCCSLDDIEDARAVARKLGMPYYVFNFKGEFEEKVINNFIETYEHGGTPNPCIECNRHLKFEKLMLRMQELQYDYVVTGHYADIEYKDGRYLLKKGVNARKRDSQDICFVPDGDYAKFIENYAQKSYPKGKFVDKSGNVLGEHNGIIRYTIGQRKGLNIALGHPVYVIGKNLDDNTVILGSNDDLNQKELLADDFNWIIEKPKDSIKCCAKTRYNMKEVPCTAYCEGDKVRVVFDNSVRAVTSGQAVVLYDGDYVLGGGTIIS